MAESTILLTHCTVNCNDTALQQEELLYMTHLMVQYLIHMDPLAVPLAVPVCFLPPHPLECPSLCHFHHLPSLQPPPTPLALPLPAPQLSKYVSLTF